MSGTRQRPTRLFDFCISRATLNCVRLLLALSLAATSYGQDKQRTIGTIEFYGGAGNEADKIRAALSLHEGDAFPASPDALFDMTNRVREAVARVTGHAPTDVATLCCDSQGNWIIYIGLAGKSVSEMHYNPAPKGAARLPQSILNLYKQTMDVLLQAVQSGGEEDRSKGYSLSSDPALRAKQLATREYAVRHEDLVRRVLESSSDAQQRIVAAHVLGYARQSNKQIAALARASRDNDEHVRNNAVRALAVIAESSPKAAERIPAAAFIEMLNSGSWTDRNKGSSLLNTLTKSRDAKVLGELRAKALGALLEMARWRDSGHAYAARILLGRIAGIEEARLQQLAQTGQVDQIINALQGAR